MPYLLKTFQECQHYEEFFIKLSLTWKVIQGHFTPLLRQNHSFMDRFWWKFVWIKYKICPKMSLLCYGDVLWFFNITPSDLITTLTYVLMDNFCLLDLLGGDGVFFAFRFVEISELMLILFLNAWHLELEKPGLPGLDETEWRKLVFVEVKSIDLDWSFSRVQLLCSLIWHSLFWAKFKLW